MSLGSDMNKVSLSKIGVLDKTKKNALKQKMVSVLKKPANAEISSSSEVGKSNQNNKRKLSSKPDENPTVEKKAKMEKGKTEKGKKSFTEMLALARRLAEMDKEKLTNLRSSKKLADLPVPCVLEVTAAEKFKGKYGDTGSLHAFIRNDSEEREFIKLLCPVRIIEEPTPISTPCVLVYLGMKSKKSGKESYHHMVRAPVAAGGDLKEIKCKAEIFRNMSEDELTKMFSTLPLECYAPGTVFLYEDAVEQSVKTGNNENSFQTMILSVREIGKEGEATNSKVYVPIRYQKEVRKSIPGVMIFQGEKISAKGMKYLAVEFFDKTALHELLEMSPFKEEEEEEVEFVAEDIKVESNKHSSENSSIVNENNEDDIVMEEGEITEELELTDETTEAIRNLMGSY